MLKIFQKETKESKSLYFFLLAGRQKLMPLIGEKKLSLNLDQNL
jgi:hypothetical protein